MPLRIHAALDRWREAERALAATQDGTPEQLDAEEHVASAREEYLAIVRVVAEEQGASAMPDITEIQAERT